MIKWDGGRYIHIYIKKIIIIFLNFFIIIIFINFFFFNFF